MKFDPTSASPAEAFDPTSAVPEDAPPVRAVLQTAVKQNPDQVARAGALGKQYGVPTDLVVRNLQDVEFQAAVDAADAKLKTSPKLAAAMRKRPDIAALAHDDLGPLTEIESNFAQVAAASVAQAVLGISEGIWRTPDAAQRAVGYLAGQVERTGLPPMLNPIRGVQDVLRFVSEGRVPAVGSIGGTTQTADKVNDAQKTLTDKGTFGGAFADVQTLAKNADVALATAVKTGNLQQAAQVLTDPNYWSAFMAQAVPSLYMAMKSGGSVGFMAWMEGMEQAGNAAEFEKKTGQKVSDAEFTQAVTQTALVNALLEKYGLDKVLGAKGGGLKGIAKAVFAEGGTEGLQQINSNLSALLAYNPEQSLSEGVMASIMGGAGSGGGMGAVQAAAGRVQQIADKRQQQTDAANTNSEHLAEQLKAAGAAALRERSPEQFRALMGEMTDGKIYVDGEVLNQLPEDVKAVLPQSVQDQIATAAATGDVVEISTADALAIAPGTALEEVLVEHARTDPFAMSKADAVEATKLAQSSVLVDAQRVIQQAQDTEARQAEYDAIHKLYVDQLNAAARFRPAVNEAKAHWLASFYTTMAARTGMTPAQFQAAHPVSILGEPSSAGQVVMDQPKLGEVSVEGYHFSKEDRSVITTGAFGTGLLGSGRDEYLNATDKRRSKRAYFYADKGTGINPEAGVGGRGHRATLTNVYDADTDPLRLTGGSQADFETKVLDAGFAGYLSRLDGTQSGQVIMLGDQTIRPEVLGPLGKTSGKVVPPKGQRPSTGRDMVVDALQANTALPSGSPTLARWQELLARTPEVLDALREAGVFDGDQTQTAYKSDLVKQFQAATEAPVYNQSVSTRTPSPKAGRPDPHMATNLAVDFATLNTVPAFKAKLADVVARYVTSKRSRASVDARIETFINQSRDNLLWLFDQVPAETRQRSKLWYVGGRNIVDRWVKKFDGKYTDAQMAGALAVMSPKMAWDPNVSLSERIVDIYTGQQNTAWSPEMSAIADKVAEKNPGRVALIDEVRGRKLSDLNSALGKAFWIRFYDEAHNPRGYRLLTPEGGFLPEKATTGKGAEAVAAYGNGFGPIAKVVSILEDGSIPNISRQLGEEHKVRNFYNNIFDPNDPNSVTIDTHAAAAALLLPLGASAQEVSDLFGAAGSNDATGMSGTYVLLAEAYRRAAAQRGVLPREMQSITWEAVRGLFSPAFKAAYAKDSAKFDKLWFDYTHGKATLDDTRQAILTISGRITPPRWVGSDSGLREGGWASSYAGDLLGPELPGGGAGSVAGRPGGDAAEGTATLAQDGGLNDQQQQTGDRGGRYSGGGLAPLEGAPAIVGATGPDARLVAVAEQYARDNGVALRRQGSYARVDPERAARIAAAYEAMPHAPNDPAVKAAYDDLIRQTMAQYEALQAAGYKFWFMDPGADPYQGNPWNAMRDLRANQSMAVFPTEAGFGSGGQVNIGLADPNGGPNLDPAVVLEALRVVGAEVEASSVFTSDTEPTLVVKLKRALTKEQGDFLSGLADQEAIAQRTDDEKGSLFGPMAEKWGPFNPEFFVTPTGARGSEVANPLLVDTGVTWAYGSPDGEQRPVLANDLFRAVHDAFGHGLEGAGFRAEGEENAWQAHVRLFTGPAVGAITSETRGQNSWLNYGPHGESNRAAKVEDTVFAEQKTGLMPEWTWAEGRVPDARPTVYRGVGEGSAEGASNDGNLGAGYYTTESAQAAAEFAARRGGKVISGALNVTRVLDLDNLTPDNLAALAGTIPRDAGGLAQFGWPTALAADKTTSENTTADLEKIHRDLERGRFNPRALSYAVGQVDVSVLQNIYNAAGFDAVARTGDALRSGTKYREIVTFSPDAQALEQAAATPRGTFNPKTLELVLNPNANLSTFFHETGHFFLEVMADIAGQPNAPAQIVEDMGTFLKWAGVKDLVTWNALDLDGKRQYHERWAESIEQYVMEGRAPSVELQSLMRRFATWLKSVYGSIKQFLAARGQAAPGGPVLNQSVDQTGTSEFKAWFGDWQDPRAFTSKWPKGKPPVSEVVSGRKPLVVYHATNGDFSQFEIGRPTVNSTTFGDDVTERHAIFATADVKFAEDFLRPGAGKNVMPLYMNIKQVADLRGGIPGDVIEDIVKNSDLKRNDFYYIKATDTWSLFDGDFGKQVVGALQAAGYDGALIYENGHTTDASHDVWVAFSPEQVKSATGNDGSFDANDPSILSQDPAAQPGPPMALNDDIRRVMDRMLATDEQIAQANEVAGLVPDADADAAAAERLNKRSIADLKWSVRARDQVIAKLQKQAKAIEKDLREQVTVEVDQTPEMRAKRALDALSVTPEYAGLLAEHKAARKAAEAATRDEVKAALLASNPDAKGLVKGQLLMKNKRDIDNKVESAMIKWDQENPAPKRPVNQTDADVATIADSFGFESVDGMLQAIDAFGSRREAIDGLTEKRMLEEHGDLIDERAISEAANEAVHNEARARSLASELRTQSEMLNPRQDTGETTAKGSRITVNALVEAAKQFAANVVARTTLRDLTARAWQHTAAERRAAKRWQEATAAGKTAEAVKAKQDQMLNHAAAKAAIDAKAEAKKIFDFFKRVTKGNDETVVEKGRDADIVNAARAVLAAYGVETATTKRADEYLEAVGKNDPETFNVLAPMIEGATRNAQPLDAITFEELQALNEEIQAMWFLAKRSRQMEVDGDLLDVQDVADEVYARLEEIGIPDTLPGETGALTEREIQARRWLQQVPALLRRVEQWAEAKDGKFGGPFLKYIFQPVKDAADRYRADRIGYRKKFGDLVDAIAPMMPAGLIQAPEIGYVFGRGHNGIGMSELLHAIAHTGNESNKRKLLLGRGWAAENADGTLDTSKWDALIQRLVSERKLLPPHFDFVQGIWDLMEQTKPLAQKTHREVFGRYFAEVTADPFVDPFGVQRAGGYIPAQADPLLVQDADLRELLETDNAGMSQAFPATARGFTKSRVEYNRPLKLDLRTLPQHIDKVLLFSHMEPAVRGVARLLRQPKVSQPLARVDPAAIGGMLKPWLNRSARQTVETPVSADAGLNRVLSTTRARVGMALMFGNVSNTLQQITGFSSASLKVKPALMMRATAQFIAHPKQFKDVVWALSPYMADRASNEVAVLSDTMEEILINPGVLARAESWVRRHAYFLQTAFDNVMSPIIWAGAYNQAVAEGMDERMAVRYADGVIRQTQGSTLPEDVSRIETGPAYARVFTQFIGYFNMLANTNATALQQIAQEQGLKKGAGKAFGVVMLGLLAPIWVAETIAHAMRGGPDDEDDDGYLDDWMAAVFGFGTIRGLLSGIPFLGQAAQAGVNRFNSQPADDKFSLSPTVSVLESAVGAPASVYGAIVDDKNAQKAVRDVSALITVATGLPGMAVARPLGYLAGVAQGRIEPTGTVDAARGLVTGTPSPESRQR